MTNPDPKDGKARDRARTEATIVAAAREVLADAGFQGFGVNAVARRAGCDKQLIYRYFGGLEGLVAALGADLANWLEDSLAAPDQAPPATYAELAERLVLRFLDALRGNQIVQRIAAWEISDPSPLVAQLSAARGMAMMRWVMRTRGDLTPPEGIDAPALNALLIGAVQQLVLAGASTGGFVGVPLKSEEDWARIRAAVVRLTRAAYAA
jgi:AcrR family transcriptional regulator